MTSKEALNELSKYIERLGGAETQDLEDIILRDLDEPADLLKEIEELKDRKNALEWALTMAHKEINEWKESAEMWKKECYEQDKRSREFCKKVDEKVEELGELKY